MLLKITQNSQENTSLKKTCTKLLLKFIHYIVSKLLIKTVNDLYMFLKSSLYIIPVLLFPWTCLSSQDNSWVLPCKAPILKMREVTMITGWTSPFFAQPVCSKSSIFTLYWIGSNYVKVFPEKLRTVIENHALCILIVCQEPAVLIFLVFFFT